MIVRNAARCRSCNQEIESKTIHDFRFCKCGRLAVDGGHEYLKRVWSGTVTGEPDTVFDELSELA